MEKRDLILHPVRLRILANLAGRQLTTTMLAAALPNVPQATLYRQIKILWEGGLLEVVAENEVRGALERTYAVSAEGDRLEAQDVANLSREDYLLYFNIFAATLLDNFNSYIQQADLDRLPDDGLSFNQVVLYLNDAERATLRAQLTNAIRDAIGNSPTVDRRAYTLASVVIPTNE